MVQSLMQYILNQGSICLGFKILYDTSSVAYICIGFVRYFFSKLHTRMCLDESTSTKSLFPDFDLAYDLYVPNSVFTVLFERSELFRVLICFFIGSLHSNSYCWNQFTVNWSCQYVSPCKPWNNINMIKFDFLKTYLH